MASTNSVTLAVTSAMSAKALLNYLTTPLISPNKQDSMFKSVSAGWGSLLNNYVGVPIWTEEYSDDAKAAQGLQLVIRSTGGAEKISDNYVPEPRKFILNGYLKGITFSLTSVLSTMGVPTGGSLAVSSIVSTAQNAALLQVQKNVLRYLRASRRPFNFRTTEGETVQCLMDDLRFDEKPDAENVKRVHIELTEWNALALDDTGEQGTTGSKPESGSMFGSWKSVGVVAAQAAVLAAGSTALSFMANKGLLSSGAKIK